MSSKPAGYVVVYDNDDLTCPMGWCPAAATCMPRSNWGRDYPLAVLLENAAGELVWFHSPSTPDMVAAAFRYYR